MPVPPFLLGIGPFGCALILDDEIKVVQIGYFLHVVDGSSFRHMEKTRKLRECFSTYYSSTSSQ